MRISSYIILLLCSLFLIVITTVSPSLFLSYGSICLILIIFILYARNHPNMEPLIYMSVISIIIVYLIRIIFIGNSPEFFSYSRLYYPNINDYNKAFWSINIFTIAFLGGLIFGYKGYLFSTKTRKKEEIFISEQFFKTSIFYKIRQLIYPFFWIIFIAHIFFMIKLGWGVSGAQPTMFGFILRLLPINLFINVLIMILIRYRFELSKVEKLKIVVMLLAYCILLLLQGHKSFLVMIPFVAFIFLIIIKGDFRIRIRNIAFLIIFLVIGVSISFPFATSVRSVVQSGYNTELLDLIGKELKNVNLSYAFTGLKMFTGRLCGFDGLLIVQNYKSDILRSLYTTRTLIMAIFNSLVPNIIMKFDTPMTIGKAVGVYYSGVPESKVHAGALGLYGTLFVLFDNFSYVFTFIMGLIISIMYNFVKNLNINTDLKIYLKFYLLYLIFTFMISGNFDGIIPEAVLQTIYLCLFYIIGLIFYNAAKNLKYYAV